MAAKDSVTESILRKLETVGSHNLYMLHSSPSVTMAIFREHGKFIMLYFADYVTYSDSDGHMVVVDFRLAQQFNYFTCSKERRSSDADTDLIDIIVQQCISAMRRLISTIADVEIADFTLGHLLIDLEFLLWHDNSDFLDLEAHDKAARVYADLSEDDLLVAIEPGCLFYGQAKRIASALYPDRYDQIRSEGLSASTRAIVTRMIEKGFRPWPSQRRIYGGLYKSLEEMSRLERVPCHKGNLRWNSGYADLRLINELAGPSYDHINTGDMIDLLKDVCHSSFLYHRHADFTKIKLKDGGFYFQSLHLMNFKLRSYNRNYGCWWKGREVPHCAHDIIHGIMATLAHEAYSHIEPSLRKSLDYISLVFDPDHQEDGLIVHLELQQQQCDSQGNHKTVRHILPSGAQLRL